MGDSDIGKGFTVYFFTLERNLDYMVLMGILTVVVCRDWIRIIFFMSRTTDIFQNDCSYLTFWGYDTIRNVSIVHNAQYIQESLFIPFLIVHCMSPAQSPIYHHSDYSPKSPTHT